MAAVGMHTHLVQRPGPVRKGKGKRLSGVELASSHQEWEWEGHMGEEGATKCLSGSGRGDTMNSHYAGCASFIRSPQKPSPLTSFLTNCFSLPELCRVFHIHKVYPQLEHQAPQPRVIVAPQPKQAALKQAGGSKACQIRF